MFRKQVKIELSPWKMGYHQELITLGSCFSDTVGEKLKQARMNVFLNSFGTIFHPIALADAVIGIDAERVIERDNYFFHWQLGGKWSDTSRRVLTQKAKQLDVDFQRKLKEADVVMVTFGTAWGYTLKEEGSVVANCHKMPQQLFEKKLFSVEEILNRWKPIIETHQDIRWIFTVSPVRHWKDGVRENNVSKGILHHAVHELLKNENVFYFPAYEILLDELRDYRFYKDDYLHPNKEAITYIWNRFRETYFDQKTDELVKKVEQVEASKSHELLYPESMTSQKFLEDLAQKEEEINRLILLAKS